MADDIVERLKEHGYADGNYWNKCHRCEGTFMGDKQAPYCKGCATSAPEITRLRSERDEQAKIIVAMRMALKFAKGQLDELINRHYGGEIPCNDDEAAGFDSINQALALTPDALADMRMVPTEATEAMIKAGAQALYSWRPIADKPETGAERVYRAMIGETGHE